ncbi:MAG: DUF4388 domain-containing protein [Thermodesulfobacteriota bacterium]
MSVKGRLADIRPRDILEIFVAEHRTAAVHLTSPLGFGHIYISEGAVVHALYRDKTGQEALSELMSWHDGEFEVEPDAISPERSIDEETSAAALDKKGSTMPREIDETDFMDYADDSVSLINKLLKLDILERI